MWLTVLCADNRGAQNHHHGEGTQNAVHGRHSTNAAAYTIAILPEKWNNTQNYNIKFTNSAWNVQGTTTMKWDHHLPCVSSVRYLITKSLECFVSTQLLYPQCYEENLILIQHTQRDKMKSSNGNNLMS